MDEQLALFAEVNGFTCPPEFWPALGYEGDARYVAIWWEQCGDEASWDDGRSSLVGAEWPAYQALIDHNLPLGHAARWLLGASDGEATMKLIIDRETERAWLSPADEAHETLRRQWPVVDAAEDGLGVVSFEELMATIEHVAAGSRGDRSMLNLAEAMTVDLSALMAQQVEKYEALVAALRARPVKAMRYVGMEE